MRANIAAVALSFTTGIGMFTTMGASAVIAATGGPMKPKSEVKVKAVEKEFKNCRSAAAWLSSATEPGKAEAFFATEMGPPVVGRSARGRPTVSSAVGWNYDYRRSKSTITVPSWPNMSDAEKAAVRRYLEALKAHEDGHHRIAQDFLAAEQKTITGKGRTAAKARADLNAEILAYAKSTKAALQERSDLYDKKTVHGIRQSRIGGEDVKLACP